jgi:uncharacterized protein YciI
LIVCEITKYRSLPAGEIRSSHMRFLKDYGERGKILLAGRFADLRGAMIIWKVKSLEEAQEIAKKDPYLDAGLIDYELREWPVLFNYTTTPPQTWNGKE